MSRAITEASGVYNNTVLKSLDLETSLPGALYMESQKFTRILMTFLRKIHKKSMIMRTNQQDASIT